MLLSVTLAATSPNPVDSGNPLSEYIQDLDEMGRTLSGWEGDDVELGSWFFSSYAMLILQNNGNDVRQPFPTAESLIPELWSDFKYINPRYLVELAGGALSFNDMMLISRERPFSALRTEEQFILHVAGMSYLRMLESAVGDSTFKEIIGTTLQSAQDPKLITRELINAIHQHSGSELSEQFSLALNSGSWMDVSIQKVRKKNDSLHIYIKHEASWSFPVDVMLISKTGDSTALVYGLNGSYPLRVPNRDYEKIILDPDHKLAEFYRFNNKWPRLKDNVFVQPFAALPDWEYYRVVISPNSWSDWDGEKRYALKMTSGFGIDLWPAYPSDYRHRISLELNAHSPVNADGSWGSRLSYGHPLLLQKRLFSNLSVHTYDDWSGASVGVTKYIGKQSFLVQGPRLKYQRVSAAFEMDR
ncbi:MAG: hypothetical protein HOL70_07745, partial [Candidatus Marinimicrobia bacterium]|nr:hypothetical protein [Candidatus Neomarinimicrobiota bacterium]